MKLACEALSALLAVSLLIDAAYASAQIVTADGSSVSGEHCSICASVFNNHTAALFLYQQGPIMHAQYVAASVAGVCPAILTLSAGHFCLSS